MQIGELILKICIFVLITLLIFLIYKLVDYQFRHSSDNNPIINQVRHNLQLINPQYLKIPIKVANKSYTQQKKVVYLCIQDPDTKEYYDMNTIMYVALHEVAHVLSTSYSSDEDHNDEWKQNFNQLLKRASFYGFYNPSIKMPQKYCGI